ncbi:hypothetical protein [Streptomyces sp. SID13031]|uniref:hypothetical protein n=1 Tax=Streptomyces sp. SID13031 TaxID=2706046 RepID=UPI0013CB4E25|nr:hypothetical protein [Streptomyces sp. SID13031]NEA35693.1 hypothetical protein [Streptomyces sp. SID13031]
MLNWLRKRRARARAEAAAAVLAEETRALGARARGLAQQGRIRDASVVLRSSGNPRSERMLVGLLREYGYLDKAISILRASTDPQAERELDELLRLRGRQLAQSSISATSLGARRPEMSGEVSHLLEYGQIDEAIELLKLSRLPADRTRLEALLRELRRTDELREVTNASIRLKTLRAEGRLDGLRTLADAGSGEARTLLVEALAEQGDLDQLRPLAVGDEHATLLLLNLLAKQERVDELRAFMIAGDTRAKDLLLPLLGRQGRLEELRNLNDPRADAQLVDQLLRQGLADQAAAALRERPKSTDQADYDWHRLASLYAEQGRTDDAIAVLREHRVSPGLLAELLAGTGEATEAIAVLDASKNRDAPRKAARLRAEHGRLDELRTRADAGDRASAKQLAAILAADGELDELRTRAAGGDWVYQNSLVQTLGSLGHLDELETLDVPTAGLMWWATVLANADGSDGDADAVAAALAEHESKSDWYTGENGTARIIDLLVEKGRIGTAIALATARFRAGDESAEQWIPRPPLTRIGEREVTVRQLLTKSAVTAIRELLPTCSTGEERRTKARMADSDYAMYCDLWVTLVAPDRAEIAVACWTVYTDAARYFGDDPPDEAERELQPEGTAITDLAMTVDMVDDLADHLKGRDLPRPAGRHLTITIPLPTAQAAS